MKLISASAAPRAIGPYTHAIHSGNLLYCSGQTPIHPESMKIEDTGVEEQTRRAVENLRIVLGEAGLALDDVIKTNVYLTDMANFNHMNSMYRQCFGNHSPARTTIGVVSLPYNALVEIECIAEFKN
jgi:2-iminobutanoate/2-iminopropanoate deaminase